VNVFEHARDVIFGNEERASGAQYFESQEDAEPQDLRVVLAEDEPRAGVLQTDALVPGNKLWVRQSELAARPPEDSRFLVGARLFRVRTAATATIDGSWWICDVDRISAGS
jgi:hypothetical protein